MTGLYVVGGAPVGGSITPSAGGTFLHGTCFTRAALSQGPIRYNLYAQTITAAKITAGPLSYALLGNVHTSVTSKVPIGITGTLILSATGITQVKGAVSLPVTNLAGKMLTAVKASIPFVPNGVLASKVPAQVKGQGTLTLPMSLLTGSIDTQVKSTSTISTRIPNATPLTGNIRTSVKGKTFFHAGYVQYDQMEELTDWTWSVDVAGPTISDIEYSLDALILAVDFQSGLTINYQNVPYAAATQFAQAKDIEKYYNQNIKGIYAPMMEWWPLPAPPGPPSSKKSLFAKLKTALTATGVISTNAVGLSARLMSTVSGTNTMAFSGTEALAGKITTQAKGSLSQAPTGVLKGIITTITKGSMPINLEAVLQGNITTTVRGKLTNSPTTILRSICSPRMMGRAVLLPNTPGLMISTLKSCTKGLLGPITQTASLSGQSRLTTRLANSISASTLIAGRSSAQVKIKDTLALTALPPPPPPPPPPPTYTISITAPAPNATVSGNITFTGVASGFVNVEVWWNGAIVPGARTTPDSNTFAYTVAASTTGISNGNQTFTVFGWDAPAGQPFTHTANTAVVLNVNNPSPPPPPPPSGTPTAIAGKGWVNKSNFIFGTQAGSTITDYNSWVAAGWGNFQKFEGWQDVTTFGATDGSGPTYSQCYQFFSDHVDLLAIWNGGPLVQQAANGSVISGRLEMFTNKQAIGYYEAMIKIPGGLSGSWPAWWCIGQSESNASVGTSTWGPEIDCFEFYNADTKDLQATLHHGGAGQNNFMNNGSFPPPQGSGGSASGVTGQGGQGINFNNGTDYAAAYHKYAWLIDTNFNISIWVDDVHVYTWASEKYCTDTGTPVFVRPIVNLAVGSGNGQPTTGSFNGVNNTSTSNPWRMSIQWIRIWGPSTGSAPALGALPSPFNASNPPPSYITSYNGQPSAYQTDLAAMGGSLPLAVNLIPSGLFPPVYDQLQYGSCVANATSGLFEYELRKQGLPDFMPSRMFLFYEARSLDGTISTDLINTGTTAISTFDILQSQGVPHETLWPYVDASFSQPPTSVFQDAINNRITTYFNIPKNTSIVSIPGTPYTDDAFIVYLMTSIAAGYPVSMSFNIYDNFQSQWNSGGVISGRGTTVIGGHCIDLVGYDILNGFFYFRNSWGTSGGLPSFPGYGQIAMPMLRFGLGADIFTNDLWTIRVEI